jgi:hypothetical protein
MAVCINPNHGLSVVVLIAEFCFESHVSLAILGDFHWVLSHLYQGNAALLTESLEVIQRTAALILSAIENPTVEIGQTEQTEEPEPALAKAS